MADPLWRPSHDQVVATRTHAFARAFEDRLGVELPDHAALHQASLQEMPAFWELVWDFCGVRGERGSRTLVDADAMPGARFFPDARLNFAENLLGGTDPERDAVVFRDEDGATRRLSGAQLRDAVLALAAHLSGIGVEPGDRVAGYLPNIPEAIVAMLATAAVGGVWTSCSPDFGVSGLVDRFGQTAPKALFATASYTYKGRRHDLGDRLERALRQLPSVEHLILVPYGDNPKHPEVACSVMGYDEALQSRPASAALPRFPFHQPLYILYSSGTTGQPKCIVHSAGGTLLKHLCEHQLMCDVRPGDRVFYFTTLGWMMWNWLASALASGATLLLFDGNPFWPSPGVLFDYASDEACTLFGTSAKYIEALQNAEWERGGEHDLGPLRTVASTGSPLAPEGFDFVYDRIKADVCLSSIAGGTDIVGCFMGGDPTGPVWRGEIQAPTLGMAVDVVDQDGASLLEEKGELVCRAPFPSMPLGFWGDASGARYRAAYFERYPGIWHHGDYAEITTHGGIVMHGRSDATLNPGGVRIGTSEIYRQVERLSEVEESVAIGQEWGDDVRIVLFVRLRDGLSIDDDLRRRIRQEIRAGASPRHVPARIVEVDDIPRTKSGKLVELAVRDVVHGREISNRDALANPGALEQFKDRSELQS